jgi:alpha-N-arabinofuranosidase
MANIAQTVNVLQSVILTDGDKMVLTPTYHVFEMFKVHQGAVMVPTFTECDDVRGAPGHIPSVSASASRDASGGIHLSLCNWTTGRARRFPARSSGRLLLRSGRIWPPAYAGGQQLRRPDRIKPEPFGDFSWKRGR